MKLFEASMTKTATAYLKYLKSLDKTRLFSIASQYHRVHSMDKSTPKMDLVYTILQAEHGDKWFEKDIRLPEYAKKFLKEVVLPRKMKLADMVKVSTITHIKGNSGK